MYYICDNYHVKAGNCKGLCVAELRILYDEHFFKISFYE